ncbi:MAG: hypothetical protein PHX03_05600 [Bacilli bacterium]|nr:hypothetical protein [Bacilli bacterium]MDD4283244.1 hypothetical protein [Bacilli bacterium]MDD4410891.1 hypothetical protein [Bacilli bacterium]
MFKKIANFMLVGFLGILLLPSMVKATTTTENFNVHINYKEGVSSTNFVVEYCTTFDVNDGHCTAWAESADKESLSLALNKWDSNNSWSNYVRISKDANVSGYDTKNYTIIYETAINTEVSGTPIYNFLGDDNESTADDVNEYVFEFSNDDAISNNTYVISIYPTLKSFGWNFEDVNPDNINDSGIDNGTAELKTNESDSGNILIKIKEGDYQILPGTEVTIELLPNTGYQLTSLQLNGTDLIAGENVGYFKFVMPENNLHFRSIFERTEDIINKNSTVISDASVVGSNNLIVNGNLRLSIEDISDASIKERLDDNLTSGNVAAYLDLNLDNVLFKGSEEDVWADSLTDLGNGYVTITLELGNIELTEDSYIVYEHDGNFYKITGDDVIYDETENTITFNANKFSNYAVVTSAPKKSHTLKVGENDEFIMTFEDMINGDYGLEVNSLLDLLKLTDEELASAEIDATHEEIETIINSIKKGVLKNGNFVGLYEISVVLTGNKKTDGPFTFKVKLADELKKYNTYEMIYVDDEFNVTETVVTGTVKDGYIIFTLPHLSAYALTASNVENPQTGDGIMSSVLLGSISLIGLLGTSLYLNKKRFN